MIRHTSSPVVFPKLLTACALLIASVACQPGGGEEAAVEAAGERVENMALGVAIAELPSFFKVKNNSGAMIELVPADPAVEGLLTLVATAPETGGINLVASIEEHKAELLAKPDGEFKGQREMTYQLGAAFYSRGLYGEEGRTMEETKIHALHPEGDRKLILTYLYPSGDDSPQRLNDQLFAVLGELEVIEGAPAEAAPSEG